MSHIASPRVFFYVQHLLGIGHLARASRIAQALMADGFTVAVVTGGTPVAGFPGHGVTHVALPPVVAGDAGFSGLADINGNPVDEAFQQRRRDLLIKAYRQFRPDIVLIEAFPFGRRQVRFELLPLLAEIDDTRPRPVLAASLRDILQERAKPGRDEETVRLVHDHFDRVIVHGDPAFARLEDTFPLAHEIAHKLAYTGLVAPPVPPMPQERFDVVVSAGGGAVGGALITAALEAQALLPHSGCWCLIAGPNLPQDRFDAIVRDAPATVGIFRFREDFSSLLRGARLSISQAGYNTVCDILQAGCRALLVPFTAGGETEQATRAMRLHRLGLAHVLPEEGISGQAMAGAVEAALVAAPPATGGLDVDGAQQTAKLLRRLLDER